MTKPEAPPIARRAPPRARMPDQSRDHPVDAAVMATVQLLEGAHVGQGGAASQCGIFIRCVLDGVLQVLRHGHGRHQHIHCDARPRSRV